MEKGDQSGPGGQPRGSAEPEPESFGIRLEENLAVLRRRLRRHTLMAEPLPPESAPAASVGMPVMLLWLDGRARPDLVERVRRESARSGPGGPALFRRTTAGMPGRIPAWLRCPWTEQAAVLLEHGYVLLLADGLGHGLVAPATIGALLHSTQDEEPGLPPAQWQRRWRVLLGIWVLKAPATLVALTNYHQEMIPTPFLLGLVAARENLPLPLAAAVFGLEMLMDALRSTVRRVPVRTSPVLTLLLGATLVWIMVSGGIIAVVPGTISLLVQVALLGMPPEQAHVLRPWRYAYLVGAALFGLVGMTTVAFLLGVYASRAEAFGVPFLRAGLQLNEPGAPPVYHAEEA